ncbi:MAG TPA: NUDIX domain-containing protein [Patescibacteria group bacterium]|nr:NUDIX domain-containing protein [Patescibacteria group bacterium]
MREEKENENRTRTAGVVVIRNDEILLVEHKEAARHISGVWGFPAGRLEEGESEKEAAVRELEEEAGLRTSEDALIDFRNGEPYLSELTLKHGLERMIFHIFLCTNFEGELRETDETRPQWVKISELSSLNTLPNIVSSVEEAQRYLSK